MNRSNRSRSESVEDGPAGDDQALWFTAPRTVERRPVSVPAPEDQEVIVDAEVSAISAGTELLLYRDEMPTDLPADETLDSLEGDLAYPLQYGYATVGEVTAVGADVSPGWLGRRVFSFQPHQTRRRVTVDDLVPVPGEVDTAAAGLLAFMESVVNLVMDATPRIGERVIVHGAGVIGLCALDLLDRFPLGELVVVDPIHERRERARAMGADSAIPPGTQEGNFDVALEVSGDPAALDDAVSAVGYDGRVIVGSWYGRKQAELDLGRRFHRDRVSITSSQVSSIDPDYRGRWSRERRLAVALDHLATLETEPLITHRIPFAEAERAYELLDRSPEEAVQILLTYE